jgi:glycogen debranching enzyme
MISLPGLTISTGRYDITKTILRTFAKYVDKGMLPNLFPDAGETPEYNTVDATLWYFEAIRAYYFATEDKELLSELFPLLVEIIDRHIQGTRYNIQMDDDGLLYAGESGVQLTWMDAKVGQKLLTSYGLRSLSSDNSAYIGVYGGNQLQRDGSYHQGTTWGWLIGHFVQAHLKVYRNSELARSFLLPIENHLQDGCVGSISEIFDGDAPFTPRGCFAQAWSVAEVLRGWLLTENGNQLSV